MDLKRTAACTGGPCVILTMGPVGSGKTTIARALSAHLGAQYLGTDQLRRQHRWHQYEASATEAVYNELFQRLEILLSTYDHILVDATFFRRSWRNRLLDVCRSGNARLFVVVVTAPLSLRNQAVASRGHDGRFEGVHSESVLLRVDNQFEDLDSSEIPQYTGVISAYRSTGSHSEIRFSADPWTSVIHRILRDALRPHSAHGRSRTPPVSDRLPPPLRDAVQQDLASVALMRQHGSISSIYVLGSLATDELSFATFDGKILLLSDYDLLFLSRGRVAHGALDSLRQWAEQTRACRTFGVIRSHIGYRCYTTRDVWRADALYRTSFLVAAALLDGLEVRRPDLSGPVGSRKWSGREGWIVRLCVLANRLPPLLQADAPPDIDLKRKYHAIRAAVDLATCVCLDHGVIPSSHLQAAELAELLEGHHDRLVTLAREAVEVKLSNTDAVHRFPRGLWERFRRALQLAEERWDCPSLVPARIAAAIGRELSDHGIPGVRAAALCDEISGMLSAGSQTGAALGFRIQLETRPMLSALGIPVSATIADSVGSGCVGTSQPA